MKLSKKQKCFRKVSTPLRTMSNWKLFIVDIKFQINRKFMENGFSAVSLYGTKYSIMDQVEFAEDSL